MRNAYDVYKEETLATNSSNELVGRLYNEGAIVLKRAVLSIRDKDIQGANDNILKAENILSALDGALDMSYPVSTQLRSLYGYMINRLLKANSKKDPEILNEVAGLLFDLRNTWEQAIKKAKAVR